MSQLPLTSLCGMLFLAICSYSLGIPRILLKCLYNISHTMAKHLSFFKAQEPMASKDEAGHDITGTSRLGLIGLPGELFQEIVTQMVIAVKVRGTTNLRLVNKSFDNLVVFTLFKHGLVNRRHILDGRCRKCQIPGSLLTRFLFIKLETVHGRESYLGQVIEEILNRFEHLQLPSDSKSQALRHKARTLLIKSVAERVPAGTVLRLNHPEDRNRLEGLRINNKNDWEPYWDTFLGIEGSIKNPTPIFNGVNYDVLQGLVALAASLGDVGLLERAISSGAFIDGPSEYFTTAIQASARLGQLETVNWLMTKGVEAFPKHETRSTPLDAACHEGHRDVVKLFLNYKHRLEVHPCPVPQLDSAVRHALKGGHANLVALFLERRTDMTTLFMGPMEPFVAMDEILLIAAACGNGEIVVKMLGMGADIDGIGTRESRTAFTRNAIEHAAAAGRLNVVKLLLERGSDPSSDRYHNAFVLAAREKRNDVVEFLLSHGANINHVAPRPNHWRRRGSALMSAASRADYYMVEFLLRKGADVTAAVEGSSENQGSCALTSACRRGNAAIARLLINAGVSPNKKEWTTGKGGKSNLYYAGRSGVPGIMATLWELGARDMDTGL